MLIIFEVFYSANIAVYHVAIVTLLFFSKIIFGVLVFVSKKFFSYM